MTKNNIPVGSVVYRHNCLMEYYRIYGTIQVCACCGKERKGSVASEVFVVFSTISHDGSEVRGSLPLRVLKARYAYYLRKRPEEVDEYLPDLPKRIEWAKQEINQCRECFTASATSSNSPKALPPLIPMEPEDASRLGGLSVSEALSIAIEKKRAEKQSTKAKPKSRALTAAELGSF